MEIIKDKLNTMPAEASEPMIVAPPSEAARRVTVSGMVTPAALVSAGGLVDRQAIYRQILALAERLIAKELHSLVPYLLRRAAACGPMSLPQLYAELQRSGSLQDLVMQQWPDGVQSLSAFGITVSQSALSSFVPTPAPVAFDSRGDY
jgi:hypothetical protein